LSNDAPARHPPDLWGYTLCGQYPGVVYDGRTVTLQCSNVCERQLAFRYVIVQFPLIYDQMTVCEIEVYAIRTILFRYVYLTAAHLILPLGYSSHLASILAPTALDLLRHGASANPPVTIRRI